MFRLLPAQGPLGSVSGVHGVFSDKDLLSTSQRHPKTAAIECMSGESFQ